MERIWRSLGTMNNNRLTVQYDRHPPRLMLIKT